jgi:hypothetical protein
MYVPATLDYRHRHRHCFYKAIPSMLQMLYLHQ